MEEENNGLGIGILGAAGLGLAGTVWNSVAGRLSQKSEFEQQEYLMDKQNEYNDPRNQMERMLAAGINPNVAGAQIAANQASASPAQVPSNSANAAGALTQAADAVNKLATTPTNVQEQEANANYLISKTVTENALRPERINELKSIFNLNDAQAGLFEYQSQYYLSEASARINLSNAQSELFKQQIEVYKQQIENYKKEIELIDKKIDSEGWLARMNQYNSYQSKWYADQLTNLGFDPRNPIDSNMFSLAVQYGPDSEQYNRGIAYFQKQLELQRQSDYDLFYAQQQKLFDNSIQYLDEYMKKELGNKYKGLGADIINELSRGFGIAGGAYFGGKLGAIGRTPIGYK
ncbi:MAG: hypothetical protein MJZ97_09060 [Bacteroidales bacterium]|nr:hypothetical protein [Bacteroidales bacterium]